MSVEKGLFQLIQTDSEVAALVNMANNNGLYWILAPKGAVYPLVVLSRVATTDTYTFSGPVGFRAALFQIDCYASQYYPSRAIADATRELLESFSGTLPDVDSTMVGAIFTTKDWDSQFEEGSVGFVFRSMLEFRVWYYDPAFFDGGTFSQPGTTVIDGGNF